MSRSEKLYDALIDDPKINGQEWCCMSFVSPENLIERRELFYMNCFLYEEVNKSIGATAEHMAKEANNIISSTFDGLIETYSESIDPKDKEMVERLKRLQQDNTIDESKFVNKCTRKFYMDQEEISDKYTVYSSNNYQRLLETYERKFNDTRCSVRGFKVRGAFKSFEEAKRQCENLQKLERNVGIAIAPVGTWVPWDPSPDAVQDSEYMLPELNKLMNKYNEQNRNKEVMFEERKKELMSSETPKTSNPTRERIKKKLMEKEAAKLKEDMEKQKKSLENDKEKERA
jgi:hypothetical protein